MLTSSLSFLSIVYTYISISQCHVLYIILYSVVSLGARRSYPALRVKVFFFADSGSPEGRLQFPGGWPSVTFEQFSESTRLCWAYTV